MSILQSSASREFKGQPVKLTEADMVTLEAMGVSIFGLPDDHAAREKMARENAGRDMILGTFIATRDKDGKRAAFCNPERAKQEAFDWFEDVAGGDLNGMGVFYELLADRKAASVVLDEAEGESGELPP